MTTRSRRSPCCAHSLAQIDEIETGLSSTYTKQGATCSITLQGLDETGIGSTYYDRYDNDSDKELAGYTPDYEEGTVLAVALKGGDGNVVLDSYVAESHPARSPNTITVPRRRSPWMARNCPCMLSLLPPQP